MFILSDCLYYNTINFTIFNWIHFFQEFETLKLEISEIEKGIESTKQDVEKCEACIVQFKEEETQLQEQVTEAKVCGLTELVNIV